MLIVRRDVLKGKTFDVCFSSARITLWALAIEMFSKSLRHQTYLIQNYSKVYFRITFHCCSENVKETILNNISTEILTPNRLNNNDASK